MATPAAGSAFAISTPSATIELPPTRSAEVPFTVTNLAGRTLRAKAMPRGIGAAPAEWFRLGGDAEQQYEDGAVKQVRVVVDPALGAPEGRYTFRLDVAGVENPAAEFAEGPECAVDVPGSSTGLTTPRGYLATLTGAAAGGVVWLAMMLVIWKVWSDNSKADCGDFGECIGQVIGLIIVLGVLLVLALILMIVGGAIGVGVALRIKHYRGNKLTALFFGVLMVPWTILWLWILSLLDFLPEIVLILLVPIVLLIVPALLARALVLLIRTHRI